MLTAVFVTAADWTVRDSQAPNYFKTTLESISRDDKLGLVSSHIHLTGVAPDQANDLRFIIARVWNPLRLQPRQSASKAL